MTAYIHMASRLAPATLIFQSTSFTTCLAVAWCQRVAVTPAGIQWATSATTQRRGRRRQFLPGTRCSWAAPESFLRALPRKCSVAWTSLESCRPKRWCTAATRSVVSKVQSSSFWGIYQRYEHYCELCCRHYCCKQRPLPHPSPRNFAVCSTMCFISLSTFLSLCLSSNPLDSPVHIKQLPLRPEHRSGQRSPDARSCSRITALGQGRTHRTIHHRERARHQSLHASAGTVDTRAHRARGGGNNRCILGQDPANEERFLS